MDASERSSYLLAGLVVFILGAYVVLGAIAFTGFRKAEATDRRIEQVIADRVALSCAGTIEGRALLLGFVDRLVATASQDGDVERAEQFRRAERKRILGTGVPPGCDGVMGRGDYVDAVDMSVRQGGG